MSVLKKARDLVKRFGAPAKFAAKIVLGVVVPGSPPVIDLIEKIFDSAVDTAKDNLESLADAKDLQRVEEMFDVLQKDFADLMEKIVRCQAKPELGEDILCKALATEEQVRIGAERLQGLAGKFDVMLRYQQRIAKGVEELQALQPEVVGVCAFLKEWKQAGCSPAEVSALLKEVKAALGNLAVGRASQAEVALEKIAVARPRSAAVACALATSQVVSRQFVKAGKSIDVLRKLRPNDPRLDALQQKVTVMTGAGDTPVDLGRAPMAVREGDMLDGWKLVKLLGHGGWGQVYLATKGDEKAAIKIMHPELSSNPLFVERFRKEITALIRLGNHPNLISIRDFGCVRECWYLVMEYVDCVSLERYLKVKGALSTGQVYRLFRQVAAALKAAHDKGITHRDIKPANILIRRGGNAVLADFGLAGIVDEKGQTKLSGMTAYFAAPEQLRLGIADKRSDVYSLAASMYFTLMYDQPGKREPHCFDAKCVKDAGLCQVLECALMNDPNRRPNDAGAFMAAWDKPIATVVPIPIVEPAPIVWDTREFEEDRPARHAERRTRQTAFRSIREHDSHEAAQYDEYEGPVTSRKALFGFFFGLMAFLLPWLGMSIPAVLALFDSIRNPPTVFMVGSYSLHFLAFVASMFGVVLGLLGWIDIRRSPEKLTGLWKARLAILFSLMSLLFYGLICIGVPVLLFTLMAR